MAGGGKSSQSSRPVDMTPEAFESLQVPFANLLSTMLFGGPVIGGADGGAGGTGGGGGGAVRPAGTTNPFAGVFSPQGRGSGGFPNGSASPGFVPGESRPYPFFPGGPGGTGGRGGAATGPGTPSIDPDNILGGIPRPDGGVAQLTDAERAVLESLQQFTESGGGTDVARATLEGIASGEDGGNPFLEGAIEAATRTTRRGLEETLSRTLPGRFTEAGQFVQPQGSSAFDRAAAIATEGASAEISDIAREMAFLSAESERQRQLEAAVELPGISRQEIDALTTNLQAQALPRLIEQHGIDQGIEIFNNQMQAFLTTLGIAGNTAQPVIAQQSSGSSRTKPNIVGAL